MNGLRKQPWYPFLPLVPIHILAYLCNFTNCFFNATPTFFAVCACLLRTDRGSLSGNHGSLPASAGRAALPVFSP